MEFHLSIRSFGHGHCLDILLTVLVLLSVWIRPINSLEEVIEYCQFEIFEAECPEGEIVVMEKAHYGRMRLGRCVVADLGYVGCYTDVLHLADRRCSGRRKCRISIPDEAFDRTSTCLTELKSYLEASYKCVKVSSTTRAVCSMCNYGVKLSASTGKIASIVAEETGCGTPDCPWIIEVSAGQRVNISLVDFALARNDGSTFTGSMTGTSGCRVYATVKEESVGKSFTVCGGDGRQRHVYTSLTNTVEVRIVGKPSTADGRDHFLLQYEALGCPDPKKPAYGWFKRSGNKALVGCDDSGDRWELSCHAGKWRGKPANCTAGSSGIFAESVFSSSSMPSGLSIVVILAVAVTIGLVIFIVGLIVLKSRQGRHRDPPTVHQINAGEGDAYNKANYESRDNHDNFDKRMIPGRDKNEYAHIWEMPLPQPRNGNDVSGTLDRTGTVGGGYEYRSNTLPTYSTSTSAHDQSYGNNTLARMDHNGEHIEREEDPRYFQLDPEVASIDH